MFGKFGHWVCIALIKLMHFFLVSTPANHLNVYDHSLFGSHLSTGQNLSMVNDNAKIFQVFIVL